MINIKFRGYDSQKGWVYGDLTHAQGVDKEGHIYQRIEVGHYAVDPDTIGIGTGVKDINDKEVFTGDIVRIADTLQFTIVWHDNAIMAQDREEYSLSSFSVEDVEEFDVEIIGNVYGK